MGRRLIAGTGIPLSPQEFMDTMQVKLEIAFRHTTILPGIQKLVSHLHEHNIPIAVSLACRRRILAAQGGAASGGWQRWRSPSRSGGGAPLDYGMLSGSSGLSADAAGLGRRLHVQIATGSKKENYLIKTGSHPDLFGPFGDKVICGGEQRTT